MVYEEKTTLRENKTQKIRRKISFPPPTKLFEVLRGINGRYIIANGISSWPRILERTLHESSIHRRRIRRGCTGDGTSDSGQQRLRSKIKMHEIRRRELQKMRFPWGLGDL